MAEKGIFTAWHNAKKISDDIRAADAAASQPSSTESKPESQKRRRLLGGILGTFAAAAISAIPHGRITTVENSAQQPDPEPDLSAKRFEPIPVETPGAKGPASPEVKKQYMEVLREVIKELIKLSPEFQSQFDALDGASLNFSSSDQKTFDIFSLELHSRGGSEDSVLFTKVALDGEGGIKELVIRNGLLTRIDKIKAEQGYPRNHLFGPEDMRGRALELAQKKLGKSQASDWLLQNRDTVAKNNNTASKDDESWEINRQIDQSGYLVSQTVRVGQVNIEARRTAAVAKK